MPYPRFDRSALRLRPLAERTHDLDLRAILPLDAAPPEFEHSHLESVADRIVAARARGAPVILLMGAHVLRDGVAPHLIDLMERGFLHHVGINGGAAVHDYEMALVGATTESVARYIRTGEFGLWEETGGLNECAIAAAEEGIGLGETIGRRIAAGFPHATTSVLAAAYRLGVPATVHLGIGYDIFHEHPNCDGAALGASSYTDFLVLAHSVSRLEGGVFLCAGSAVMGPEVYLKALAMARNVAHQQGREIRRFTSAVFDLADLGDEPSTEAPKSDARYYFRPWKTVLVRTVADGGESFYIRGRHRATIANLHRLVRERAG